MAQLVDSGKLTGCMDTVIGMGVFLFERGRSIFRRLYHIAQGRFIYCCGRIFDCGRDNTYCGHFIFINLLSAISKTSEINASLSFHLLIPDDCSHRVDSIEGE
jgi:hypothetical protein